MFDWDSDLDSITAGAGITREAGPFGPAGPRARPGLIRGLLARWIAPAAVMVGLVLAGQSVFQLDLVPGGPRMALSSSGALRAALFQADDATTPAQLLVYEDAQYTRFMRGIVQFSDADLLEYAATTARDLGQGDTVMRPYLLDALWLTHRQIERRGLSRPVMSVAQNTQPTPHHAARRDL